ncbi:MAG: hypothetical protein GX895_06100 [Clostridiales bacterium]|uniref:peptidyl-prolyl cis-trans isomerase n=1 Tax=Clostridium sp. N3C TaxID=1776758 RepID=UPI00092DFAB0|nr:peptidyl-prolyl cis-trans isomerase [Clostridium sp. N3C]NLZ48350.1 hypothetical protein [Clostridiales bacterium]SCN23120.1 Foldase protein PrsA precursor [Clostridium sp. N3C]
MNKVKKVVSILVTGLLVFSASGCIVKTQAGKDNTVVAKVGGEKIKVIDVRNKMKSTEESIKEKYGNLTSDEAKKALEEAYVNALENMAQWKLLEIVAKENYADKNIIPDLNNIDEEAEKQVSMVKELYFENDDSKFEEGLKDMGMTVDSLKDQYRETLRDNQEIIIASRVQYEIIKDLTVSDDEISSYYTSNIASYTTNAGANFYHIVVDTEEKAKEVKEKLNSGSDFKELAKEYSTDSSASYGGYLGYIQYDNTTMAETFMSVAKALGEGEVSDPIKTSEGKWEIIKAEGVVKETKVTALEEVKDQIKEQLLSKKRDSEFDKKVEEWKKEKGFKLYEDKLKKNIL